MYQIISTATDKEYSLSKHNVLPGNSSFIPQRTKYFKSIKMLITYESSFHHCRSVQQHGCLLKSNVQISIKYQQHFTDVDRVLNSFLHFWNLRQNILEFLNGLIESLKAIKTRHVVDLQRSLFILQYFSHFTNIAFGISCFLF